MIFLLLCGHVYGNSESAVLKLSLTTVAEGNWKIDSPEKLIRFCLLQLGVLEQKLNMLTESQKMFSVNPNGLLQ